MYFLNKLEGFRIEIICLFQQFVTFAFCTRQHIKFKIIWDAQKYISFESKLLHPRNFDDALNLIYYSNHSYRTERKIES